MSTPHPVACAIIGTLLLAGTARAQVSDEKPDLSSTVATPSTNEEGSALMDTKRSSFREFLEREHLFGDPYGVREWLEKRGLSFDLVYTAEGFMNARGGKNTSDAAEYRGDTSLYVEFDTGAAGLWSGGTLSVHVQEEHGEGITEDHVGDFQVLSNIDADDFIQLSEIHYRQTFLEEHLWFKIGKQDTNNDFAGTEHGGEFINSSGGFSPTIPLVTYPDPDWGAVLGVDTKSWFSVLFGVFQGRPDGGRSIGNTLETLRGPMVLVEPALHYSILQQPGSFRVAGWWNGDRVDEVDSDDPDPGTFTESYGLYMNMDQLIWKVPSVAHLDDIGLGLFAQFAWVPEDRNELEHHLGGGIEWQGCIPGRMYDIIGVGVFYVKFSDQADFEKNGETAIEFFYKYQAAGFLSLKPDLQIIRHPGGTSNSTAVAIGIRAEISF